MKKILIIIFFFPLFVQAQLKEFEVKEMEKPKSGVPVQANTDFPDNALIFVYSSLEGLNFRSSMSGINKQNYNKELNRYEIFINPVKQILSVGAEGFIGSNIATLSPSPKEYFYFTVELKVSESIAGKTQLKFDSSPSDALIEINELETNYRTPFDREVNSGLTKISLKKDKYLDYDTLLNLIPDKGLDFKINMVPEWVDLSVSVQPQSARIVLDNKIVGTGNIEYKGIDKGINPGIYDLKVDLLNHRPFSQKLDLKSGKIENLNIELQPILGRIKVKSDTEKAEVFLNGSSFGYTPFDKEIIIGDYNLILSKQGFREETKTFKLTEGILQEFNISMLNYSKVLNPLKTKAMLSYIVGIAGVGSGVYFMQSASKNYKAYQTSSSRDEAAELRSKVEMADRVSPIGYAVGGVGLLGGIIFSSKIKKYKKQWDLAALPVNNGGFLSLKYNF